MNATFLRGKIYVSKIICRPAAVSEPSKINSESEIEFLYITMLGGGIPIEIMAISQQPVIGKISSSRDDVQSSADFFSCNWFLSRANGYHLGDRIIFE
jgi:hypothetical protein